MMLSIPTMRAPPTVGGGGNFKCGSSKDMKNIQLRRCARVGARGEETPDSPILKSSLDPEEESALLSLISELEDEAEWAKKEILKLDAKLAEKELARESYIDVATFVVNRCGFLHPLGAIRKPICHTLLLFCDRVSY